jgi:Cu(I)/Ag(I) efflux system membrane fusion protein/cobalt-zinc-cadmium efflux system membrane fusion protein
MTRRTALIVMTLATWLAVAAPASAREQNTSKPAFDITLTSKPTPPTTGSNTFEVTVKDAAGTPVTDADVSLQFYMAAMPAMKMPEMRNTVPLKHTKNGVYSGAGSVMMAGSWDVTVSVKRAGKEVASKKLPVAAK